LCVDDDIPPFAFVIVEGTASFVDDGGQLLHWATRIAARYMGSEQAEAFGKRNAVPGELLARVTIAKLIGQSNISSSVR
jgi:hypothetical protein